MPSFSRITRFIISLLCTFMAHLVNPIAIPRSLIMAMPCTQTANVHYSYSNYRSAARQPRRSPHIKDTEIYGYIEQ